ncbi:uncharacterized protein C15orf61 isoform X1 [Lepeophtheirus salmonis]|uniref:uncharacterized protein C15orf61 isoform X1 n=1 Tax=Lepeophtheirus salmonis TaxID=72036 RepID=UPI003AF3CAF7
MNRYRIFISGIKSIGSLNKNDALPTSSHVLYTQLRQRNHPHWTAWYVKYVPYSEVQNDLWGCSCFNLSVDGINYQVLRTGAFPFIKFHCSRCPNENLIIQDIIYRTLKVINLGIPTFLYGLAGLLLTQHTESVKLSPGKEIFIYFWYKESPSSKY